MSSPISGTPPTLADALRAMPVPAVSAEFDDSVLCALLAPPSWRRRLWSASQPLLLGASASLAVTLLLLHFTLSAPVAAPVPTPAALESLAAAPPAPPLPSVDALLDRPGLCAGSLTLALNDPPAPEAAPRPPAPRRRAAVTWQRTLIA